MARASLGVLLLLCAAPGLVSGYLDCHPDNGCPACSRCQQWERCQGIVLDCVTAGTEYCKSCLSHEAKMCESCEGFACFACAKYLGCGDEGCVNYYNNCVECLQCYERSEPWTCDASSPGLAAETPELCTWIASGQVAGAAVCPQWVALAGCDTSWYETCGTDHPSSRAFNHVTTREVGSCPDECPPKQGSTDLGYGERTCVSPCGSFPTTCDTLMAMLNTGGCAAACTFNDKFAMAIDWEPWFDKEEGCMARYVTEQLGADNMAWLTDDAIWQNWVAGTWSTSTWPACANACNGPPTSCEEGVAMVGAGGCTAGCTYSERQVLTAMLIGIGVFDATCANTFLTAPPPPPGALAPTAASSSLVGPSASVPAPSSAAPHLAVHAVIMLSLMGVVASVALH